MDRADTIETRCSADRPPKRRATWMGGFFIFFYETIVDKAGGHVYGDKKMMLAEPGGG